MPLTEVKIKSAKPGEKRYQIADSDGLYIEIMTSGKKYWRLRYFKDGKRSWHTIGEYPATGLQEARERRNDLRKKLRDGDPLKTKGNSFFEVALEWADAHDKKIKNEKDKIKKRGRLNNHLLPFIGEKDITTITAADILPLLQRLADRENYEMMSRIRSYTSQIFRYGVATGRCSGDPTYALRGAIITPKKRNYPTITKPDEIGVLLRAIDAYPHDIVRRAMQFSVLTFVRPGEARQAEWDEIWEDEWHIPPGKMKMDDSHVVPLASQTIEVLEKMRQLTGHGKYVFPSTRTPSGAFGERPMSNATVLVALRTMGYTKEQIVPHGFRAMASTRLRESGLFHFDWIERQLAHAERNKVSAAYNYAEYLPDRRKMMQWWANYLDELRGLF